MSNTTIFLRGEKPNPFHLSVGQVIVNKNSQIALLFHSTGEITLPRETTYSNESYEECLQRGAAEEIGAKILVKNFIGSQISTFFREDHSLITKTTIYFLTNAVEIFEPEKDETGNKIKWMSFEEAQDLLKNKSNPEFEILENAKRLINKLR